MTATSRSSSAVLVAAFVLACGQPASGGDKPGGSPASAAAAEKPWPALNERDAAEVADALGVVDPSFLPVLAARALWELEQGRLGAPLLATLDGMANADPSQRAQMIARGLDSPEARAGWQQVCSADFVSTFAVFASVAPADRIQLVRAACDPAKLRLLDGGPSASVDGMGLMLAIIIYGALERHGTVSAYEIKILGALATAVPAAPVPLDPKL